MSKAWFFREPARRLLVVLESFSRGYRAGGRMIENIMPKKLRLRGTNNRLKTKDGEE